jgi:hypothetical protein
VEEVISIFDRQSARSAAARPPIAAKHHMWCGAVGVGAEGYNHPHDNIVLTIKNASSHIDWKNLGEICYYDSLNNAFCYYRIPNVNIVIIGF